MEVTDGDMHDGDDDDDDDNNKNNKITKNILIMREILNRLLITFLCRHISPLIHLHT